MGTDFFDNDLVQRRGAARSGPASQPIDIVGSRPNELPARPVSDLNLTRMTRQKEEVNAQVASAKLEIEKLRRRQTDLEREQQALEDLLDKQDQYERGKQELLDKLGESVTSLQKLEDHAARQVEIYSFTRRRFMELTEELQKINDSEWADEAFREELNKAVVAIDSVRKEFVKAQAGIEAAGGPPKLFDETRLAAESARRYDEEKKESRGFGAWFKIGLAASLPLIAAIAVAVIILIVAGSGR